MFFSFFKFIVRFIFIFSWFDFFVLSSILLIFYFLNHVELLNCSCLFPEFFLIACLLYFFVYYLRYLHSLHSGRVLNISTTTNVNVYRVDLYWFRCLFLSFFLLFLFYFYVLCDFFFTAQVSVFFYGMYYVDSLVVFFKLFFVFCSTCTVCLYKASPTSFKVEFFFVYGYSVLIGLFLLSSYNFIYFFINLEALGMCLYILFAVTQTDTLGVEAALKYFVVSTLSSAFLLFAITFFFGYFGTFYFFDISLLCLFPLNNAMSNNVSFLFIMLFLAFFLKLGMVPLHVWVFDVYEGVHYLLMCFLLCCVKPVFFYFIFLFISRVFYAIAFDLFGFLSFIAFLTMFLSALLAVLQITIRRFIICSSMVNSGILLFSLLSFTLEGYFSFIFYLFFYNLTFLFFLIYLYLLRRTVTLCSGDGPGRRSQEIALFYLSDFLFIKSVRHKFVLSGFLLSFIGLPPFGGFFLKYFVLLSYASISNYLYIFLFLLSSTFSAYYYLRVLKLLWVSPREGSLLIPALGSKVSSKLELSRAVLCDSYLFGLLFCAVLYLSVLISFPYFLNWFYVLFMQLVSLVVL